MLSFILWIAFGALIGFLADLIDKKHSGGILVNIIVGILGSIVGGWLAGFLGIRLEGTFSLLNIVMSVIGALIVLAVYRFVTKKA